MPNTSLVNTVLVAAVSSDGKIADERGDQSRLTNDADRAHLRSYIRASDVLLFGHTTYNEHREKLGKYRCVVLSRSIDETREIESGHLLWNPNSGSLGEICGRLGAKSVCILGGSHLYTLAKERGWIDELVLTYVPGVELRQGIPLFTDLPGVELWPALEDGRAGFRPDGRTAILTGCEKMEFPFQLRKYRKERA